MPGNKLDYYANVQDYVPTRVEWEEKPVPPLRGRIGASSKLAGWRGWPWNWRRPGKMYLPTTKLTPAPESNMYKFKDGRWVKIANLRRRNSRDPESVGPEEEVTKTKVEWYNSQRCKVLTAIAVGLVLVFLFAIFTWVGLSSMNSSKNGPCSSMPCQNHGTCINIDESVYKCQCSEKFTGINCQIAVFNSIALSVRILILPWVWEGRLEDLTDDIRQARLVEFCDEMEKIFNGIGRVSCVITKVANSSGSVEVTADLNIEQTGVTSDVWLRQISRSTIVCGITGFNYDKNNVNFKVKEVWKPYTVCNPDNSKCLKDSDSTFPSFWKCDCGSSYKVTLDEMSCEDVNECSDKTDGCAQSCFNTQGTYYCGCVHGYRLSPDLRNCIDIDECTENTTMCDSLPGTTCYNHVGAFACLCESGFTEGEDGQCIDIDECEKPDRCAEIPDSYCQNIDGGFLCLCQFPLVMSENAECIKFTG